MVVVVNFFKEYIKKILSMEMIIMNYELELIIKMKQEEIEREAREAWKFCCFKPENALNLKRILNNLFNLNRKCCECN